VEPGTDSNAGCRVKSYRLVEKNQAGDYVPIINSPLVSLDDFGKDILIQNSQASDGGKILYLEAETLGKVKAYREVEIKMTPCEFTVAKKPGGDDNIILDFENNVKFNVA